MEQTYFDSTWFIYGILPFLIFISRIVDVSLDTLRIVFISKGNKIIAPILGFFGVLIWLVAITRIMQNLDNVACYIAYAGGFAAGNYVGLIIEEKLAVGVQVIRIITHKESNLLISKLRDEGFGVTVVEAEGKSGKVHIIFSVVQRNRIQSAIGHIINYNPNAFYSIEDVRAVNKNNFGSNNSTVFRSSLVNFRKRL